MKDIRIDGRTQRVFVLKENESRMVYIPVKALMRTDYERLKDFEANSGRSDLMDVMSKVTLDNGRNALDLYKNVIQVMDKVGKNAGERLRKPEEKIVEAQAEIAHKEATGQPVLLQEDANQEPIRERRKPGPKPKIKTE